MSLFKYVEGRSDGVGVPDNVILRCGCIDRCELEIEKYKDEFEPAEYFFTFKSKSRYNNLNMIEALKIKLKKIWCIIRGKDYLYYDIEVDEQAMKEFVKGLQELVNKNS